MRTKKTVSFDEESEAEKIVLKGFPEGKIDYGRMYIVAKYFRQTFGYGAIKIERELIRFCKSQDPNFNPISEADILKKWIQSALTFGLRKVESVTITQKEINTLKGISNARDRKLLFMSLILSKALKKKSVRLKQTGRAPSDKYYLKYSNFMDIIRMSKIKNLTEASLAIILGKYPELVYLFPPEKELVRLEYADKDSSAGIEIDNFDKILDFYYLLFGDDLQSVCPVCKTEFKKTNNRQLRCKTCSDEIRREKYRDYKRKQRMKI